MKKYILIFLIFTVCYKTYSQNALSLDGVDDYVTAADNNSLDFNSSSSFTIEMWIKSLVWVTNKYEHSLIDKASNEITNYRLYLKNTNGSTSSPTLQIGFWNGTGSVVTTTSTFSKDVWVHIAMTVSSTTTKFYINGTLSGSYSYTSGSVNAHPLLFGVHTGYADRNFNGLIDEVRIWNVVRTETDIKANMFKELVGNETGLVGYWKFNDGTGTTATNSVSGGGSGTLTNGPTWVTSYAPMSSLQSSYTISQQSIWQTTGTSASTSSNGLQFTVGTTLTESNFMSYGNNNTSAVTGNDLSGTSCTARTSRIWYLDVTGTVSATAKIDFSDATGGSVTASTASNYKLLRRDGTSGDFSVVATGSSIASTDQVTFGSYTFTDGYYAIGTIDVSSPLPIELKYFTLKQLNGNVILNWSTVTESNNFGFDIERKSIKSNWEKIGFIKGSGTSNIEKNYTFKDNAIKKGKYSYRLKQIDLDGRYEYQNPLEITIGLNPNKIVLDGNYPNPFNSETVISYQIPTKGKVVIELYDVLGKRVSEIFNGEEEAGFYEKRFSANNLSTGIYYYKLQSNNQTAIKKMVLMK